MTSWCCNTNLQVDGGLRPVREEDVIEVRTTRRYARCRRSLKNSGFRLLPMRKWRLQLTLTAARICLTAMFPRTFRAIDEMIEAWNHRFGRCARPGKTWLPGCGRVSADYAQREGLRRLSGQASAIFTDSFEVLSAVNNPNDYQGPGTGYRLEGKRWDILKDIPQAISPEDI